MAEKKDARQQLDEYLLEEIDVATRMRAQLLDPTLKNGPFFTQEEEARIGEIMSQILIEDRTKSLENVTEWPKHSLRWLGAS